VVDQSLRDLSGFAIGPGPGLPGLPGIPTLGMPDLGNLHMPNVHLPDMPNINMPNLGKPLTWSNEEKGHQFGCLGIV